MPKESKLSVSSLFGTLEPFANGIISFIPFKEIDGCHEERLFIDVVESIDSLKVSYPLHILMTNENYIETGRVYLSEDETRNPIMLSDDKCSHTDSCISFSAPELVFNKTKIGSKQIMKLKVINRCPISSHSLKFSPLIAPFKISHQNVTIKSLHYIKVPVIFEPKYEAKQFKTKLKGVCDTMHNITLTLRSAAII